MIDGHSLRNMLFFVKHKRFKSFPFRPSCFKGGGGSLGLSLVVKDKPLQKGSTRTNRIEDKNQEDGGKIGGDNIGEE